MINKSPGKSMKENGSRILDSVSEISAQVSDASTAAHQLAIKVMSLVDPELRPIAGRLVQFLANQPPLSDQTLDVWRGTNVREVLEPLTSVPFEERFIPGAAGDPPVLVQVINAKAGESRPGILYMHGGGLVMGTAKPKIVSLQELAAELDLAVVSVEYRLAPETTYKGSIEDNYAGLQWLHSHAQELGIDRNRIAVMGNSAGGAHAALLAITARNRGEIAVAFQMLIYPMLDDRTDVTRPVPSHIGTILWNSESNRYGWSSFLGQESGSPNVPAGAVPAREENLANLPPTFIGVGSLDLLMEEDVDYARRLALAGVPVELHVVPGAFHGFDGLGSTARVTRDFNLAVKNAFIRAFGI